MAKNSSITKSSPMPGKILEKIMLIPELRKIRRIRIYQKLQKSSEKKKNMQNSEKSGFSPKLNKKNS